MPTPADVPTDPYAGVMKRPKRFEPGHQVDNSKWAWGLYQESLGISQDAWDRLGEQPKRIIMELLPQFVTQFVGKALHYGPTNANILGPAGQYADIHRKIGPLKRALWDGEDLTQEGPDEICKDLIGHAFLTIDMIKQGVSRRGSDNAA